MLFGGRESGWLVRTTTFARFAAKSYKLLRAKRRGGYNVRRQAFGGVRADERRPARPLDPAIASRADPGLARARRGSEHLTERRGKARA